MAWSGEVAGWLALLCCWPLLGSPPLEAAQQGLLCQLDERWDLEWGSQAVLVPASLVSSCRLVVMLNMVSLQPC